MPNVLVNEPVVRRHQQILMTFIIGLLATVSIWTNKIYYVDDYSRLLSGESSYWISNGRPLTTVLNVLMRFSTISVDISPLPLIIGLLILATASVIYCEKLALPLKGYWQCIPPLFILLNPFLAQSMLFTYDSFTMLLSVAIAMVASTHYNLGIIKSFLLTTLLLIMVLSSYQIGINIYLGCLTLVLVDRLIRQKTVTGFIAEKLLSMLMALFVYKFLIVHIDPRDVYTLKHSKLMLLDRNVFSQVSNNLQFIYATFNSAFPFYRKLGLLIPLIAAYAGLYALHHKMIREQNGKPARKWLTALMLFAAPLVMVIAVPGISLLLANPVNYPRILSAWGCVPLFGLYITVMAFPEYKRWIAGFYIAPLLYSLIVMLTIFNSVASGQRYVSGVVQEIKFQLSQYPLNEIKKMAFVGRLGIPPDVRMGAINFPIVSLIRTNMIRENFDWGVANLFGYENVFYPPVMPTTQEMKSFSPEHYLSQNCDYRLFIYKETAVFDLRQANPALKCLAEPNTALLIDN